MGAAGLVRPAPAKTSGVLSELGLRPVLNFAGTHTTIGASKPWPELREAMAEAGEHFLVLEEIQEKVGERLARLCGTEAAMVTSGCAGAIALGAYACLTGEDPKKIRQLPDLTGMKTEAVIQKAHRNGYDHAIRSAGVRIVEVDTPAELDAALARGPALMYFLGGTSHDWEWETPLNLDVCVAACKKAGVPLMVDAANMLPPWGNIPKLAAAGADLIALSAGKHMRGPQSAGILAGPKHLIRAAWLNSSPHSDSQGRPFKVGREEMIATWLAAEKYSKLDFAALDKQCEQQAAYLMKALAKLGLTVKKTPFDRTRRVHRVQVSWDEKKLGMTAAQAERSLKEGEPRIAVGRAKPQGLEFTVFMNDPGDERIAAARMEEIFKG
jgi:L-seryl-tRNA(Ser) seleniumtransferase